MSTASRTGSPPATTVMQGLAIMLFAMMILPCMDAIAKYMAVYQAPGFS
ncbi:hypothetical protein OIU34_26745 [Pararhizobium sp. BT-229]|nr:hypothetical protein [Pararhizobium sp. BT-229]MCV9965481.1 hypothetical protein [Pararhizobium sp. BT-229]